jgi:hypothetical protein
MASVRKRVGKKGTTYSVQVRVKGYDPVAPGFFSKTER